MTESKPKFTQLADLAAPRLGGRVLAANDDFFAPKENLLKESKPVFIEGQYTSRGKWMDGWETRRRRTPCYDWCIVRLGLPGVIRGVVVDTSFFTGNYPEHFSLEACDLGSAPTPTKASAQRFRDAMDGSLATNAVEAIREFLRGRERHALHTCDSRFIRWRRRPVRLHGGNARFQENFPPNSIS
jgi:allantoicase